MDQSGGCSDSPRHLCGRLMKALQHSLTSVQVTVTGYLGHARSSAAHVVRSYLPPELRSAVRQSVSQSAIPSSRLSFCDLLRHITSARHSLGLPQAGILNPVFLPPISRLPPTLSAAQSQPACTEPGPTPTYERAPSTPHQPPPFPDGIDISVAQHAVAASRAGWHEEGHRRPRRHLRRSRPPG